MKSIKFIIFLTCISSFSLSFSQSNEIIFPLKHTSTLISMVYSKNRNFIATSSNDNTIKIWKSPECSLLKTIYSNTEKINSILFINNDSTIVSCSNDSTIVYSNIFTNNVQKLMLSDKIISISINNSNSIIAGTNNGYVYLIELNSLKIIDSVILNNKKIEQINCLKSDNYFIVATSTKNIDIEDNVGSIFLFDFRSLKKPMAISNYKENINRICLNSDSTKFISASSNGMVRVWDAINFVEEISFKNNNIIPDYIFISPNNKMVAVTSLKTNKINIWRISGEKIFDFNTKYGRTIYAEFNAQSTEMNICSNLGNYEVYDLDARNLESLGDFLQTQSSVTATSYSNSEQNIAIGFSNGTIRGFNFNSNVSLKYTSPQISKILALSYSENEKLLFVSSDQSIIYNENTDKTDISSALLTFLDNTSGGIKKVITNNTEYFTSLYKLQNYCIAGLNSGTIKFYSTETTKELYQYKLHDYDIVSINQSSDKKLFITSSLDATLKIWQFENNKISILKTETFNNEVINAFVSNPKFYISNVTMNGITIFNNNKKTNITSFCDFSSFCVNEKDSVIFCSLNVNQTECNAYSITNGNKIWNFQEPGSKICNVKYLKNFNLVSCVLENGYIELLNPKNGKKIITIVLFDNANWLAFTPENKFDASELVLLKTKVVNNLSILNNVEVNKYYQKGLINLLLSK